MILVLFFLAAAGLAFILGHSKITLGVRYMLGGVHATYLGENALNERQLEELRAERVKAGKDPDWEVQPLIPYVGPFLVALVECPGCLGWWIGATTGWIVPELLRYTAPNISLLTDSTFGLGVVLGLATAATNMLIGKVMGVVE